MVHQQQKLVKISIHVPREGDDCRRLDAIGKIAISIHVPREGDDHWDVNIEIRSLNFNPRPP